MSEPSVNTPVTGMEESSKLMLENMAFLEKEFPQLFQLMKSVPVQKGRIETAKNGSPTLVYRQDDTPYYIHSRFNPQQESLKLLQKRDLDADHIVVMGLGLGYHLEKIMELKDPLSRVLLVEPEVEIFKHSLHNVQWKRWLKRKDFFYVLGPDPGLIAETIHQFINITAFDKVEFVMLPSETRILGEFFKLAKETIQSEIKTNLYDFKTRLAESYMVPRNILNNLPLVLKNRPIAGLKDMFKGMPGIIVSAGPSLDKNVLFLKKTMDRAITVAVDTALKPLLSRGIQPHFTAIGDPSHKNYLHLQGTAHRLKNYIVAEAGIAHQVYKEFPGKLFSLSIGKAIVRMLESHSQPWGEIEAWGSVISIALHFAIYIGLNPIIFVGQDFAFSNNRNHCRGTSWEENKIEYSNSLDDLQRYERQSISGNRKVMEVDDIYGQKTFTSERLVLYKNFLARLLTRYPDVTFINATEGGIFSEIPCMNLYDALKQNVFICTPVDVSRIAQVPTLDSKENIQRLLTFLNQKHDFFNQYLERVDEVIEMLEKSVRLEAEKLLPVLQHAEQLQGLIYTDAENGEIVEMWSAAPMYQFLREYKSIRGRQLTEATLRKGMELFKEYYRGVRPIIKDIVRQFKKTATALEEY